MILFFVGVLVFTYRNRKLDRKLIAYFDNEDLFKCKETIVKYMHNSITDFAENRGNFWLVCLYMVQDKTYKAKEVIDLINYRYVSKLLTYTLKYYESLIYIDENDYVNAKESFKYLKKFYCKHGNKMNIEDIKIFKRIRLLLVIHNNMVLSEEEKEIILSSSLAIVERIYSKYIVILTKIDYKSVVYK